jgi:hypothetical protein
VSDVVGALEETGLAKSTFVFYSSDHGCEGHVIILLTPHTPHHVKRVMSHLAPTTGAAPLAAADTAILRCHCLSSIVVAEGSAQ